MIDQVIDGLLKLMRKGGLEPPCLTALDPAHTHESGRAVAGFDGKALGRCRPVPANTPQPAGRARRPAAVVPVV